MQSCHFCETSFPSRNKLFVHIREFHQFQQENKSVLAESEGENDASSLASMIKTVREDEWYRVVIKPQGIATMGNKHENLINSDTMLLPNAVRDRLRYKKAVPCHRLDKATGGLVVCSKNKTAEIRIKIAFRLKLVRKKYVAIVVGCIEPSKGTICVPLEGQYAESRYETVSIYPSQQFGFISMVFLFPITGKRHQLRRHLHSISHPILGDRRYSLASSWPRQSEALFLYAIAIQFPHPRDYHCNQNEGGGGGGEVFGDASHSIMKKSETTTTETSFYDTAKRDRQSERIEGGGKSLGGHVMEDVSPYEYKGEYVSVDIGIPEFYSEFCELNMMECEDRETPFERFSNFKGII
jgi:23S rRNA-/tRNA-specific pseudouridylate synthase